MHAKCSICYSETSNFRIISRNLNCGGEGFRKMLRWCKHARSTNLHWRTLENRKKQKQLGGVVFPLGGSLPPPFGRGVCVKISLSNSELCWRFPVGSVCHVDICIGWEGVENDRSRRAGSSFSSTLILRNGAFSSPTRFLAGTNSYTNCMKLQWNRLRTITHWLIWSKQQSSRFIYFTIPCFHLSDTSVCLKTALAFHLHSMS